MSTPLTMPDRDGLKSPFPWLHHIALITNDMPKTVAFYRDVLGSEVALAHRLGREGNERHYFITVAPNTVFAFFEFPAAELQPFEEATLPKTGRMLDHICFFVENDDALEAWRQRLTEHNVPIHQYAPGHTLFFHDPNNIVFQISIAPAGGKMGFPVHNDPDPAYTPPS
jgi:catechol 2,3-dioxygenase-like lactoylglutathione lyase family enzyme